MSARFDMGRAITKAILEAVGTDFLLKDGSRAMTGNLDMGENYIIETKDVLPHGTNEYQLGNASHYWKSVLAGIVNAWSVAFTATTSSILARNNVSAIINIGTVYGGTSICAIINTLASGSAEFQIPRAGDITMLTAKTLTSDDIRINAVGWLRALDNAFIQLGNDTSGTPPTPSATYRGALVRINGGEGVADKICVCVKKADDSYGWFDLIADAFI